MKIIIKKLVVFLAVLNLRMLKPMQFNNAVGRNRLALPSGLLLDLPFVPAHAFVQLHKTEEIN